jgi:WD40-like Beta Propeller Repeat
LRTRQGGDLASAFSPWGGWIVYGMTSAPRGGLVLVRADGRGDEQRLTDPMALGLADADDFWPAFAPDGKRTIRPDGTGLHKIVDRGREPDWSPDRRRIVYGIDSAI